jgi:hypothetical protein
MVPQPRAAVSKSNPRIAPARRRVRQQAKRWPLFWTIASALAASAVLWAIIYFTVTGAAGLVADLLAR